MNKKEFRINEEQIKLFATLLNNAKFITPLFIHGGSLSLVCSRFTFDRLMVWSDLERGIVIEPFYFNINIQIQPIFVPKIDTFKSNIFNHFPRFSIGDFGTITSINIYKTCSEYQSILLDIEGAILFSTDEGKSIFLEFSEEANLPTITMHTSSEKIDKALNQGIYDYSFRYHSYELSRII
jgi:hypothetical protein